MNRYRMGLTIKDLIALDASGKLKRRETYRRYARQMTASVFRGMLNHLPNVVNRIDEIGNTKTYDLSYRRYRGQRTRH